MKLRQLPFIVLILLCCNGLRAQQFDIGMKLFFVKQEGNLLNTIYNSYQSGVEVDRTLTCIGGRFGVYQPLYINLRHHFSLGGESGLYFAYNKKKHTIDKSYFDLQVAQSKLASTIGVFELPLMGSLRTGKIAGLPEIKGRSVGFSGGMHVTYLYVSNERGFFISPAFSAIFGTRSSLFFRLDILSRIYTSEYETTLGNIPRLSNKCWALSLNLPL